MSTLFFWNSWVKDYRYVWYALAVLFTFSAVFLWYHYFQGPNGVIEWQKLQEQKVLDTNIHTFQLGPFQLNVPGESYVLLEYLNGSQITPNTFASYIYLTFVFLGITMLATIITALDRMWFYISAGLLILFLVNLRFEVLGLFGLYNKFVSAAIIISFIGPAFCINQFRSSVPFLVRLLIFGAITTICAIIIGAFSQEPLPFYHLVITSFAGTFILALVFMIIVSHEIFAAFVHITSQGSSKALQHLAILSTIYFVNVLLTLLHELGIIKFDFIYINVFLLLTISAFLGVWGFRSREPVYQNVFRFYPTGGFFFLTLGMICLVTIGHHLANANDSAILVLRHGILFSHAAYGLIFLLYLLSNFGQMLWDNAPVYKVLYNPVRMPYFTYRLAGFIAMIAIVIYAGWREYVYNSFSGFYNIAGDFYSLQQNELYARSFYEKASAQGFQNHHSNYSLAIMKAAGMAFEEARNDMAAANGRRPTPYSLTNAGNLYIREGDVRKAIDEYKKNLLLTDDNAAILNNLAVAYTKIRNYDSAIAYLSKAREEKLTKTSAETNFFGLAALEMIPIDVDSVYKSFGNSSPATLCNVYALSAVLKSDLDLDTNPLNATQLDLYTATLLNNYIIRNAKSLDTTFTSQALKVASDSSNLKYSEALKASLAFAYYHQGNISKALEILAEQVFLSQSYQGKFNYIMGLWALEQLNPEAAASYFNFADTQNYKDAPFYFAIALTEAGKHKEALQAWDSVASKGQQEQRTIAGNIKRILNMSVSGALRLTDADKYQYTRYRIALSDSSTFNTITNSFENPNYKAQALLDYCQRLVRAGYLIPAINFYNKIGGLKLTDKQLYENVRHFELRLLASKGDLRGLAGQINKGIEFGPERFLEKIYYTALLNEASGDTVNAKKNYGVLARYNPYFHEGVLAAYQYSKKTRPQGFEAYNILAEAIQVNGNSLPLLRAYYDEAIRVGLEEYAASTAERIKELERQTYRDL